MTLKNTIFALTLIVGLTLLGSIDIPVFDREGHEIKLPVNSTGNSAIGKNATGEAISMQTFRVDNFNVQRGKGEDGVRDLTRAEGLMQGTDIAGVQEVSGTLFYGWRSQARQLAEALQTGYLFGPTTWRWFQPYVGSALLTKFPVQAWTIEGLPARDDIDSAHRNLITALLEIDGRPVVVMVTHLDRRESNAMQLDYVLEKFLASKHPTILLADLNTDLANEALQALIARPAVEDAILEAIGPFWRLDWIITKGFDVAEGGHAPRGISDHAHYWVDLTFSDSNSVTEVRHDAD
ncbi:MAG: endonuclease/exonuclease/phosphatase family metal-dependent hydrolase [Candidatus Azotimanducaceae bacterium]|jgi:endonuclease/exonuclease/phosphatase family metal-dependent hydrolase